MNSDVAVRDVVEREYVGVSESDPVLDTVALLLEEDTETAVVLRGSDSVGVLTQRDVLELLVDGGPPARTPVSEVMTPDITTVGADHTISEAADIMSAGDVRRLLVVEHGEVLGVLSDHDLLTTATIEQVPANAPPDTTVEVEADVETMAGSRAYSSQGICGACGSLTRTLADVNGQLLCVDCRDI